MNSKVSSIIAAVLLAILTIGVSTDSFAQARPSAKGSIISVEPFGLLGIGEYPSVQIQYEWRTSQENSIALRAALLPKYVGVSGFGFGASYRFYIAESRALTGLNVSPGVDVLLLSAGTASYQTFGVGGDVAYKWIFDEFGVEPFFRLRQYFAGNEGYYAGTGYDFGVYLGYAW